MPSGRLPLLISGAVPRDGSPCPCIIKEDNRSNRHEICLNNFRITFAKVKKKIIKFAGISIQN
jgi:hypothetical protein